MSRILRSPVGLKLPINIGYNSGCGAVAFANTAILLLQHQEAWISNKTK